LRQNILRDPLECIANLVAIGSALEGRRLGKSAGQPVDHAGADEVYLKCAGGREPELVPIACRVAGGDQPVEARLEDLGRHTPMIGNIAEACLTGSLPRRSLSRLYRLPHDMAVRGRSAVTALS
jgi:hypothetical protein